MTIRDIATTEDIKSNFEELRIYMRKCKNDTIKWMFFFAVTQPIVLYFILSLILHR